MIRSSWKTNGRKTHANLHCKFASINRAKINYRLKSENRTVLLLMKKKLCLCLFTSYINNNHTSMKVYRFSDEANPTLNQRTLHLSFLNSTHSPKENLPPEEKKQILNSMLAKMVKLQAAIWTINEESAIMHKGFHLEKICQKRHIQEREIHRMVADDREIVQPTA